MATAKPTVRVTKLVPNTDMRGVHKLRAKVSCNSQEAWLFLNRKLTIARLIDSVGGVHTYYAPKDKQFDHQRLYGMVAVMGLALRSPSFGERERPKTGKVAA